jgi:glycosyltransferase involved in cell wall biosynthesis
VAKLSVIVPVYNEANTIRQILEKINGVNIDKEIIVVDDGSIDGTHKVLNTIFYPNLKVIYHGSNRGKGAAFVTGLAHATGEFTIAQDADLEYNPAEFSVLLDYAVKNGLQAVYGSRFLKGWRHATTFFHYCVNRFLTCLTNFLFASNLTDMETCYKLVKTDILKSLQLSAERFELEPEITIKLLKNGIHISEIPVSYKKRSYRQGKKISWQDGFSTLLFIIKMRLS